MFILKEEIVLTEAAKGLVKLLVVFPSGREDEYSILGDEDQTSLGNTHIIPGKDSLSMAIRDDGSFMVTFTHRWTKEGEDYENEDFNIILYSSNCSYRCIFDIYDEANTKLVEEIQQLQS